MLLSVFNAIWPLPHVIVSSNNEWILTAGKTMGPFLAPLPYQVGLCLNTNQRQDTKTCSSPEPGSGTQWNIKSCYCNHSICFVNLPSVTSETTVDCYMWKIKSFWSQCKIQGKSWLLPHTFAGSMELRSTPQWHLIWHLHAPAGNG